MQRAMRGHLIYVVAVLVMGCSNHPLVAGPPTPGPDVTGTWTGSTAGVVLSVVLDSNSCFAGCSGSVNGGTYSDNVTHLHGTFTGHSGGYHMTPPGSSPYSAPLPGWTIDIAPVDTTNLSTIITFNGSFSTATLITGYVRFTNGAAADASDSVTISLTKS